MELALAMEKMNFQKLRALHDVATKHNDMQMTDFIGIYHLPVLIVPWHAGVISCFRVVCMFSCGYKTVVCQVFVQSTRWLLISLCEQTDITDLRCPVRGRPSGGPGKGHQRSCSACITAQTHRQGPCCLPLRLKFAVRDTIMYVLVESKILLSLLLTHVIYYYTVQFDVLID